MEELLGRKEFVELWVMKWAELLQIRSRPEFSYKSALLYYTWLEQQIANNVPINAIVREVPARPTDELSGPFAGVLGGHTARPRVDGEYVFYRFIRTRRVCIHNGFDHTRDIQERDVPCEEARDRPGTGRTGRREGRRPRGRSDEGDPRRVEARPVQPLAGLRVRLS